MKLLLNRWLFFSLLLLLFESFLVATQGDLQKKYEVIFQAIDEEDERYIEAIFSDPVERNNIFKYSLDTSISLLSYALAQNRLKIASTLIALEYPLELYDVQKWTALHWSAVHNYHEIFVILKERGADIFALDGDRLTPYDHACNLKNNEILALYTQEEKEQIEAMK